ncbi:MAG: hypothetical protein CMK83_01780 [Pseudomonadales bacterium]|nr:hypothetical protein [Pseudomonadales bacterium]
MPVRTSAKPLAITDETGGVFVKASSKRASRAARPPSPSEEAQADAWKAITERAKEFESRNPPLERVTRVAPKRHGELSSPFLLSGGSGTGVRRSSDSEAPSRATPALSHLFGLHARSIDANQREPSFLVDRVLPLVGAPLAAAGLRSAAVRNSVVDKPTTWGGSQQTPRVPRGGLYAAWAAQASSVAVTLALGKHVCAQRFGITVADPTATTALEPSELLRPEAPGAGSVPNVFLITSTARLLPHALPTRLCSASFLEAMKTFAHRELADGLLRQYAPHEADSVRSICETLVHDLNGVNVWAAWVLVLYMLSDTRLRRLVRNSAVTDMDVATAVMMITFGRCEVTRRARMESASNSKGKRKLDDEEDEVADLSDYGDDEDDEPLASAAAPTASPAKRAADRAVEVLASKKPRTATVVTAAAALQSASQQIAPWWATALQSKWTSIFRTFITQSRSEAAAAAVETLAEQSARPARAESSTALTVVGAPTPPNHDVTSNQLLVSLSTENAIRSAAATAGLVRSTSDVVPHAVLWRCRNKNNHIECRVGLARSPEDAAHTTLHVCERAPKACQPQAGRGVVAWSRATRTTTPATDDRRLLPGIAEGLAYLELLDGLDIQRVRKERIEDVTRNNITRGSNDGALTLSLTGLVRSFVVLPARVVVGRSMLAAGERVGAQLAQVCASASDGAFLPESMFESSALLAYEPVQAQTEPYASPANILALCFHVNEVMRVLMKSKARRGDACRHLCGVATPQELSEAAPDEYDKPQTLLPVVDVKVSVLGGLEESPKESLRERRDASLRRMALTFCVCGDSVVRVVEVIDQFATALASRLGESDALFAEMQALTYAAAARASELNDVATATTASAVRSCIASAKRILVNDQNLRLMLSLYQVFRAGTANVPRSYETTPWSGVYGAPFDIGTSAGIGIGASSLTADKRCTHYTPLTHAEYPHPAARAASCRAPARRKRGPKTS